MILSFQRSGCFLKKMLAFLKKRRHSLKNDCRFY